MLPEFMPIVAARMASGEYAPVYRERELTEAVDLCDGRGTLNPDAIGWSRRPLVTGNLSGHWLRKKRWNFWNWIGPDFVLSLTVADIDLASFCSIAFVDFKSGESIERMDLRRSGFTAFPETVGPGITWNSDAMACSVVPDDAGIAVEVACRDVQGERVQAEFAMRPPRGHESLNVVVPWSSSRFQLNSKHNTIPCIGSVRVGGQRYQMHPETHFGCRTGGAEFGRTAHSGTGLCVPE